MTTKQRNTISFITASAGTLASVFLVSVYIPGHGIEKAALISGELFLACSRLYLFYEGVALNEVSRAKAKTAFRLSVIMSVALAVYGCIIYVVNDNFQEYALALFLMLQMGIPFVEWVFASRTGEQVNTVLVGLQRQRKRTAELALHFRSLYQDTTKRIDLLSKENARHSGDILKLKEQVVRLTETDQSNTKTLKKLFGTAAKIERINGRPVSFCPSCITRGSINLLVGGPRSAKLDCIECGYEVVVPKKELKLT